jgi:hypothetical protein
MTLYLNTEKIMTKSAYTLPEVAKRLHRTVDQVQEDIQKGILSYAIIDGRQMITLYDLQRYEMWLDRMATGYFAVHNPASLDSIDMNLTER